jgi:anti-sigma regulatory factor (Ser/Thr protein kinase)
VLDEAMRTHPHLATPDGAHVRNDRFEDPRSFLLSRPPPVDPLEAGPPVAELIDPPPSDARHVVERTARQASLEDEAVEGMRVAVSEAVTNASLHGRRPVLVQVWAAAGRVLVAVKDHGSGPSDPYAGLAAGPGALNGRGGFGLWLLHQLVQVSYDRSEGFTVRLTNHR